MLDGVQRSATKFILNYPSAVSYKERLTKLRPSYKERLELRRNMNYFVFLFKCKLDNIQLSDYMQNRPAPKYSITSYDVNDYTECKCRTQYFKNSYFPQVTKMWNSLDKELKAIRNISFFKLKLKELFLIELKHYQPPT